MNFVQGVKDLQRLEHVLAIFFEEGLGYYVSQSKLASHLPLVKRLQPSLPVSDKVVQAMRLRRAFEHLGPTFVKLGQLLSLRSDLVPVEYCAEFERLQDRVEPFSFVKAKEIIESDLGKPISRIFKSFDQKPFASASIAQVHRAVLKSGNVVAVKVQRPDIQDTLNADLDILFQLAHALEKHVPEAAKYHPVDIVKEFALWTRRELNFERERRSAIHLKQEMRNNKHVKVPRMHEEFSSRRVLTMEFIDGIKLSDIQALGKYHINAKKVALTYFNSILEQTLIHGFFHADPHPANILVQKDGKLVYLDYGIMGELSRRDREKIIRFIHSIPEKNSDKSLDIIISLAKSTKGADIKGFKDRALSILEDVYGHTLQESSIGEALYELITLGSQYGIIFDANHILMVKAVYQAEGLGLKLDPHFNVAEGLQQFAEKYLRMEYTPEEVFQKAAQKLWSNTELLAELPEHIVRIMDKLEQPEPPERLDVRQLHELERRFEAINHWRTVGVMVSALIMASAILFYVEGRSTLLGIPLGGALLLIAGLMFASLFVMHKKLNPED